MNRKMKKLIVGLAVFVAMIGTTGLTGCNPEPDESDMYTATGETAADYIHRKPELSSFEYILTRTGMIRNLAAYGVYTCFIPTNDGVAAYIDSLYNDPEATVPHNGMTDNSLEGLSDSLCLNIARYHLVTGGTFTTIQMAGGDPIRTMLGRTVVTQNSVDTLGRVTIEKSAVILQPDSVVTNGIVHVLNRVIPLNSRTLKDELERYRDEYGLFLDALKLTGLADSITKVSKGKEYSLADITDTDGTPLYCPTECLLGFTFFAVPDAILKTTLRDAGKSEDLNGLIEYANDQYRDARNWYQYLDENGISVSTGSDYTNRFNALNMFVAYHIVPAAMPENQLVYEQTTTNSSTWNYVNGGEPFDYYETLLPNTLVKIWQPTQTAGTGKNLFINRFRALNTLTDQLPHVRREEINASTGDVTVVIDNRLGYGSDAMHQSSENRDGVRVLRTSTGQPYSTNVHALNGYIHAIDQPLIYDNAVPQHVLHERMRFDATTFLPEFINNNIRMMTMAQCNALSPNGNGARVAFPLDYFDNVVSFTDGNKLRYNVKGAYNAWQADAFQGWGKYDLAVRLPHVPSGTYELRLYYAPMGHGGMMQFYLGEEPKLSAMVALGIPLDARIDKEDARVGWTDYYEEDDFGVSTDVAMHNRGYMRGPFSFKDHPEYTTDGVVGIWSTNYNMRRGTRNAGLRRVLGRVDMKQSKDYWFRIKSVINDLTDLKWQFDFIELVPVDVVDNDLYSEDWY